MPYFSDGKKTTRTFAVKKFLDEGIDKSEALARAHDEAKAYRAELVDKRLLRELQDEHRQSEAGAPPATPSKEKEKQEVLTERRRSCVRRSEVKSDTATAEASKNDNSAIPTSGVPNVKWEGQSWRVSYYKKQAGKRERGSRKFGLTKYLEEGLDRKDAIAKALDEARAFRAELVEKGLLHELEDRQPQEEKAAQAELSKEEEKQEDVTERQRSCVRRSEVKSDTATAEASKNDNSATPTSGVPNVKWEGQSWRVSYYKKQAGKRERGSRKFGLTKYLEEGLDRKDAIAKALDEAKAFQAELVEKELLHELEDRQPQEEKAAQVELSKEEEKQEDVTERRRPCVRRSEVKSDTATAEASKNYNSATPTSGVPNVKWEGQSWRVSYCKKQAGKRERGSRKFGLTKYLEEGLDRKDAIAKALDEANAFRAELVEKGLLHELEDRQPQEEKAAQAELSKEEEKQEDVTERRRSCVRRSEVKSDTAEASKNDNSATPTSGVPNIGWSKGSWRVCYSKIEAGKKINTSRQFNFLKYLDEGLGRLEAVAQALEEAKAFRAELVKQGLVRELPQSDPQQLPAKPHMTWLDACGAEKNNHQKTRGTEATFATGINWIYSLSMLRRAGRAVNCGFDAML